MRGAYAKARTSSRFTVTTASGPRRPRRSSKRLAARTSRRRRKRQLTTNRNSACGCGGIAPAPACSSLLRRQPAEIRRDIQNVIVGELRDRALHQRRVRSVAIAVLEEMQLARQIDRMHTGNARHVAEPLQPFTVADAALDG